MKKPLVFFKAILVVALFYSCGPSAEEKARKEKHKIDSIGAEEPASMKKSEMDSMYAVEKARADYAAAMKKAMQDSIKTVYKTYKEEIILDSIIKDTISVKSNRTNNYKIPIFYGTDRKATGIKEPDKYYGTGRNSLNKYEVGIVEVSIPKTHKIGELETSWFDGMQNWFYDYKDTSKYIVLLSIDTSSNQAYHKLKEMVESSDEKDAFVFIHGFNVSFKDAAMRTAQIAYDVGFKGAPILYSWPSKNSFLGYTADKNEIEYTIPHLKKFLQEIISVTNVKKIHLIAHSMGCDILTKALKDIQLGNTDIQFNEIILAAPDIDADNFKSNIAPFIKKKAKRITIYASSNDEALKASRRVNGRNPRLGYTQDGNIFIMDGYEMVDATELGISDLFNHSYFVESRPVLTDIGMLVHSDLPPLKRNLNEITVSDGVYYKFKK